MINNDNPTFEIPKFEDLPRSEPRSSMAWATAFHLFTSLRVANLNRKSFLPLLGVFKEQRRKRRKIMLSPEEISERNGQLIDLIKELDVGIHITDMPHKPKLISHDYSKWLQGYVKNFHLLLMSSENEVFYDIRLKPIRNLNMDEIKEKVLEWLVMFEHKQIYTLSLRGTGLFITGFNHHNRILKRNPYPVFARYNPLVYHELNRVEDLIERFDKYDLVINEKAEIEDEQGTV